METLTGRHFVGRHRESSFWLQMDNLIQVRDIQLVLQGLDPAGEHLSLVPKYSDGGVESLCTWSCLDSHMAIKPPPYPNGSRWCPASPYIWPVWLIGSYVCIVTMTRNCLSPCVLGSIEIPQKNKSSCIGASDAETFIACAWNVNAVGVWF